MISRAIVQSAIVLMNRRMKVERGVIMFDSVCSSVEDMHLHHLGGTNQAQAQTCRVSAQYDSTATGGVERVSLGLGSVAAAKVDSLSTLQYAQPCRSTRKFPSQFWLSA